VTVRRRSQQPFRRPVGADLGGFDEDLRRRVIVTQTVALLGVDDARFVQSIEEIDVVIAAPTLLDGAQYRIDAGRI